MGSGNWTRAGKVQVGQQRGEDSMEGALARTGRGRGHLKTLGSGGRLSGQAGSGGGASS